MDAVHVSGGRDDAITDPFPTEEPSQSEIPEVSSRCPENDSAGSQMCSVAKEANQADCCSPVKSHSSHRDQLRPTQSSAYESPPSKTCICQNQTVLHTTSGQPNSRQEECFTGPVKIIQSCRSSHPPSCHGEAKYHCFHGSHDGIEQKHIQCHMVTLSRDDELHRIPRRYSQIIVEYPVTVLICCMVVLFACSLAGILTGGLPDFSDPMSGFEPRGTDISIRLATWMRLQESTGTGKSLSTLPWQLSERTAGQTSSKPEVGRLSKKILQRDFAEQNFFCNAPGEKYAQLVFRSGNSASLWSLKAIYSMCQMEQTQIRSGSEFDKLCLSRSQLDTSTEKNECCPSWSLGNYLALLNNVSSCFSLTAQQVSESLGLLRFCAPYYHDGSLVAACTERSKSGRCGSVPHRCKRLSIFQILHYMVDKDFLGPQTVEYKVPSLKYSAVFLPVEKGEPLMKIYLDHLEGHKVMYNTTTTITGMDFGLKQKLFKYYLACDSFYPVLAVLALLFTMGLYLKSIFLAAMSLVSVVLSLLTSYFFYTVAFHITLFPLLNLASVLVLLGSCLNHTLTFVDFWKLQVAQNAQVVIEKRMYWVLQEMGYLIVVSGLTSSITFYSGCISSITAIRCYALFLGSASLINTTFSLVWLPCVLILQERHVANASTPVTKALRNPCFSNSAGFWETSSRRRCFFTLRQKLRMLGRGLSDMLDLLFLKILPCGVVKFRYIWICWFAVLAAGGTYITCVDPGMKLTTSDSRTTQLFRSSHPFERFDAEYRHQFMFERRSHGEDKPMTLTLIWGVVPSDDRDHFDPSSNGSLHLDPDFNMSCPEAQVWLRDLCRKVQNQTFYTTLSADQGTSQDNVCFVESLIHWVSIRRCSESEDALSFCCNNVSFPYSPEVFEQCLTMMVAEQHAEGLSASTGGLRFDTDGHIIGLVVMVKTEQLYSFNFTRMSQFYHDVQSWFNREIAKAPIGLRKGWFVSQFGLYDLQQCLSSETLEVAGFSVALTFALLLLTTWNIPLSLYVSITVGGSVFATVGLLVLLEWQLNGVEALFISAAAGLSVDFVANYCISYSLAPHPDRLGRVAHSLKRMGCPVAAGAGAFFCVGIIMLPATALLFRKLGIFLLLVKCVACGFATFFFQSLCCFFGPQKNCGVITVPCVTRNILSNTETGVGSASNGAFGCEAGSRVRRQLRKGGEDFLCPTQDHHRQRQMVAGREPEQYELQPLAYQLSDSFENSTCTSKLSNRPSVLSDEIHFCGLSPRHSCDRVGVEADSDEICSTDLRDCTTPPALQTSSPYKGSTLRPVAFKSQDASIEVLCKKCQVRESCGLHLWNSSTSSCSSTDEVMITQTTDTVNEKSLSVEEASSSHLHKCLLSFQSEISAAEPEDSNETHSGDVEAAVKAIKAEEELQPGHLNGKRDTLRLSLKETVYDMVSLGSRTTQGNKPVMLPNSKPDMPDVWIKREGKGDGSS